MEWLNKKLLESSNYKIVQSQESDLISEIVLNNSSKNNEADYYVQIPSLKSEDQLILPEMSKAAFLIN